MSQALVRSLVRVGMCTNRHEAFTVQTRARARLHVMNTNEESTGTNALPDIGQSIARMVELTRREWLAGDTRGEHARQGGPGSAPAGNVQLLTPASRQS